MKLKCSKIICFICIFLILFIPNFGFSKIQKIILGNVFKSVEEEPKYGYHSYNYAYGSTVDGNVYKVDISAWSVIGRISTSGTSLYFGDIDLVRKKLILGGQLPAPSYAKIAIFINLETFTEEGYITFESDEQSIGSIIVDSENGIAYCADNNINAVIRLDISTRTRIPGRLIIPYAFGLGSTYNGAVDSNYVYFGDNYSPPRIHRIRKSDFSYQGYIEIGDANTRGVSGRNAIEIDQNLLYFVAINIGGYNDILAKIDTTTFTVVSQINLLSYELNTTSISVDYLNRFLYLSCSHSASGTTRIIKFDLSSFSRVGYITSTGSIPDTYYDGKRNLLYIAEGLFPVCETCNFFKADLGTFSVTDGLVIPEGDTPLTVFCD